MIDVVIYASSEEMQEINLNKTSTGIREALHNLGYTSIGLVSIRNKLHYDKEYQAMVVDH